MSIEVNATEQIIEVNATGSTIDINVSSQTVDVNATTSVIEVTASYNPGINLPSGGTTGQVLKKQSNTDYDTYWAVDEKGVPYVGATGDVDLGEYELKAGQIELDQSPTGTAGVAVTRWNDTIGSTETTLKGGNVILKNGVDLVARVVNKVTPNTTLTKASYQAVKVSGAQGQRLAVALAQANNDNNSADTLGLVIETIATNQEGFIMTVGSLEGINTTGSLQGETWADGDVLYLSPTIAGRLTNIKPNGSTGHIVVIGYVEYAHANNGKIYVKIMNGWELDELHNVFISSPANNDALIYESSTSLWKNKSIATALGYTPGTVSSVALSVPTGLVITSGSPITTSGTIAVGLQSGYSIPTTIKQGNWDDAYTFVSGFPTQTGNSGKYLTTDGSTLSWGTVSTANIYNSDGTLTGNRTVTMGAFDLVLTGNSITTLEINSTGNSVSTDYSVLKLSTTARTWNVATGGSTTSFNGAFYIDSGFATAPLRINTDGSTNLLTTATRDLTVDNAGAVVTRLTINNTGASNYSVLTLKNSGSSGKSYSIAVGGNTSSVGANNLYFNYDTTDTARMTLTAAGRLLIGTTTESTYLLDVNGTGRFTSNLSFTGGSFVASSVYYSSTYGLVFAGGTGSSSDVTITDRGGNLRIEVVNGGEIRQTGTKIQEISIGTSTPSTGGALYTGTAYGLQIRGRSGATIFHTGLLDATGNDGLWINTTGQAKVGNYNATFNDSAILEAVSTTKGFLPPRMTAAQKTAISTPATGLVIYQTDSTEGLYQYKSTGWEAIGGGGTNIYNSDGTLTGDRTITNSGYKLILSGANNSEFQLLSSSTNGYSYVSLKNSGASGREYHFGVGGSLAGALANSFYIYDATSTTNRVIINSSGVCTINCDTTISNNFTVNGFSSFVNSVSGSNVVNVKSTSTGGYSAIDFYSSSNVFQGGIGYGNSAVGGTAYQSLSYISYVSDFIFLKGSTVHARIFNGTGNWLIQNGGTFTDAGYKLDVQGTVRTTGNVSINLGSVLKWDNSASSYNKVLFYDGGSTTTRAGIGSASGATVIHSYLGNAIFFGDGQDATSITTNNANFIVNNTGALLPQSKRLYFENTYGTKIQWQDFATTSTRAGIGVQAGASIFYFYSGDKLLFASGYDASNATASNSIMWLDGANNSMNIGTGTNIASSILTLASTTKGFLPPRMTETQKNAISTPATGLIIYQTDGTEGLYQYKSTGWSQVAGTGGGGGISRSVNVISTTTTAGASASTDYVYLISGTTTLTLPTAVGNTNRYTLKNVGTNTVTINTTSSQTIDGSTSITMAVRYTALDVISDGTNWNII